MDKIKIKIDGRIAEIESAPEVVTDNAEYEVEFAVDERDGWNPAVPMTALFVRRDARYTAVVMDAGETICTMPPQTGTNIVYVGLTQDDMRTTTPATIKVYRSIRTVASDPLPAPTEDVYAQILAAYAGIKILSGKGAPTSATQGKVNQLYRNEDTQKLYICTATAGGYTWAAVVSDTEDAVTYTAQTLTDEQKTQARANIGAGTSNFSGLYNDLPDKPNIPSATVIDTTLTKSGQAADAKAAGDAIEKKLDKAQGTGNAGKILGIGADGNVTPQDKPVQALAGVSAPTTATAGVVGQEYYVIVNNAVTEMYVCTAVANGTYTWGKVEFGAEIDDTSTEPTKVWSAEKCNQLSEEIADCIKSPTTAEVGQTIVVKAIGDDGKPTEWEPVTLQEQVQADWYQNDNTAADYVKNRTHYTNTETVLEYGVLSGFEDDGSGIYSYILPYALDISVKAKVTWDNQVYQLTATQVGNDFTFIGNNLFSGGEDSGEPFGIVVNKKLGKTSVVSTGTEASHEVGIVTESPVRIEPYFLPSNIAYLQNGFIPLNLVIPSDIDVFGGVIVAGGMESTLENPYRNKHTLDNLTLETFNAMLDGTVYLPSCVLINKNNIASVSVYKNDGYIRVLWSSYITYTLPGYTLAGARIEIYDARIHEDADNSGTIVSEYAIINVADKQLT